MTDNSSYSEWTLYYTEEGYPYYYNSITNESIWADADAASDQKLEHSNYINDKPSPDDSNEKLLNDGSIITRVLVSDSNSNTPSFKNDEKFMQYLNTDNGKRTLQNEMERVRDKVIKKSLSKDFPSKRQDKALKTSYKNESKDETVRRRKNESSIEKLNQSPIDKQYRIKKQFNDPYTHCTSKTRKKTINCNEPVLTYSETTHPDMDDMESLCSEKDDDADDDDDDDNDLEFEQLLKDEFSFGTEWNEIFIQACQYITDHFMILLSPNFSTMLTNQRNRLSKQPHSINTTHDSPTSESMVSSITSVIKKLIILFINICFLIFSSVIHHTALIFSEVVFSHSNWKPALDYLDQLDITVQTWIKSIDKPTETLLSSSSIVNRHQSSIAKHNHQQSLSIYHSDDKTNNSYNHNSSNSNSSNSSTQKKPSTNMCSIYRECIDTDDENNNNNNDLVVSDAVDCVYMDV